MLSHGLCKVFFREFSSVARRMSTRSGVGNFKKWTRLAYGWSLADEPADSGFIYSSVTATIDSIYIDILTSSCNGVEVVR